MLTNPLLSVKIKSLLSKSGILLLLLFLVFELIAIPASVSAQQPGTLCTNGIILKPEEGDNCASGSSPVSAAIDQACRSIVTISGRKACIDSGGQDTSGPDGTPGNNTGNDEEEEEDEKTCETEGGQMSWILCPVLNGFDSGLEWFDRQIQTMLTIPDEYLVSNTDMERAWGRMRNIAFSILIPIMLVMVIGTALGFDFVSAYTIKRAMPRFAIAVIFMALSWEIVTFMVMFFNDVGRGTMGLIQSSIAGDTNISLAGLIQTAPGVGDDLASVAGVGLSGLVVAGLWGAGIITMTIVFSYALTAFLALAIGYLILVFRQMLIIFLAILAPLAILAWIFPGNDKLWKLWWGAFTKLLIMFPLIAGLIAVGKSFAFIIDTSGARGAGILIIMIAYIAPYFFIPWTFKWAGGFFATVAGIANDRGRGMFDRNRKWREQNRQTTMQRAQTGSRFKRTPILKHLNTTSAGVANIGKAGANPFQWRQNMRTALGDVSMQQAAEQREKNPDYQSWKNDDDLNKAAAGSGNATELRKRLKAANYGTDEQIDMAVSRVERVRKQMSEDAFDQMTLVSAVAGGTAYKDAGEMTEAIAYAGRGDKAKTATLTAQAKAAAAGAGRFDQSTNFGTMFSTVEEMQQKIDAGGVINQTDRDRATAAITGSSTETNSAYEIMGPKTKKVAVLNALPFMERRLEEARGESEESYSRELARVAAAYDTMNSTNGVNARAMVSGGVDEKTGVNHSGLFGRSIGGSTQTVQQEIEARRADPAFLEMRREYGSRYAEEQGGRATQQQQDQG